MAILDKTVFPKNRPYVRFGIADAPSENEHLTDFKGYFFCELPEDLIGTYCCITRSYSPFDTNCLTQLSKPYDIYLMASNFILWEFQLARTPDNYFLQEIEYWAESHQLLNGEDYTAEAFKADLIETLHYIVSKMIECATNKKCFIIEGV